MKFDKIKAGDVLYDVHSYRMGNTTLRSWGVWDVRVVSVDPLSRSAVVSWNGNREERWHSHKLAKLRAKEPKMIDTGFCGQQRLAKKGEISK